MCDLADYLLRTILLGLFCEPVSDELSLSHSCLGREAPAVARRLRHWQRPWGMSAVIAAGHWQLQPT